jgi:hypothetical protein
MNIKTSVSLIIVTCLTLQSFAQKKEYALSVKGDTLVGKIKFYSFDNLDRLMINSDGKKSNYTALQVKGFVKDGTAYESVKFENSIRFMKVIMSGYTSLYAFSSTNQNTWDSRYLFRKDGTGVELPNLSFKKIIGKFFNDCPEVRDQIDNGQLTKKDIEKIVDQYNNCIQAKTNQIISKSPVQPTAVSNEKLLAIQKLSEKVEAENFLTKKDVLDLLNDLKNKVSKNESIPNYLTEGLKTYLADTPSLSKETEDLINLLKK